MLAVGGFWVLALSGLSLHWSLNPQYRFGWFVPVLALYAGWNRWRTRPAPEQSCRWGLPAALAVAIAILPTWLFSQPNPDWPLLNWIFVGEIAALTMSIVAFAGGGSWVRHFFFPVVLIFTAVPWPDYLESGFTQGLMRLVAKVAVTLLDLIGVPALQRGNLIEVSSGLVGVSEACSGIRSLQGSLMASLFLGELFRFSIRRRGFLVLISLVVAFVTNVVRAGFLAWSAAASGVDSVERWHDPAGFTILAVCLAAIVGVAFYLDRNEQPPVSLLSVPISRPLPSWLFPGFLAWLGVIVTLAEIWYYDPSPPPESPWRLTPPSESTPVELPLVTMSNLHFDKASTGKWTDLEGGQWMLYFFEWKFGPAFSRVAAQMHRPDICLPASGQELKEDRGMRNFVVAGLTLPFHAYSFKQGDHLLFVYNGVWQFRSERGAKHGPLSASKRVAAWQSVQWRERKVGQQVAEIGVTGYDDAAQADAALAELLRKLLNCPPSTAAF